MPSNHSLSRRLAGGALVVLASVASVYCARGLHKPTEAPAAPAYRSKGDPAAPVVIVEYSDFECPACRLAQPPLKQILELYGPKVRLVFKHFPLEGPHPWARPAAISAECAGRQGRFWPFHDALYERQEEWSKAKEPAKLFNKYAKEAKLDMAAFSSCLSDSAPAAAVAADAREAMERWVGSTPTFFINRRRFVGARQLQALGTLWIDRQLRK